MAGIRPLPCLGRLMELALRISPPLRAFPAGQLGSEAPRPRPYYALHAARQEGRGVRPTYVPRPSCYVPLAKAPATATRHPVQLGHPPSAIQIASAICYLDASKMPDARCPGRCATCHVPRDWHCPLQTAAGPGRPATVFRARIGYRKGRGGGGGVEEKERP
jgi:hypothetical protein